MNQLNTEGYNESTEPTDAVCKYFASSEIRTTPDIDATNCATETSQKGCSSSADIDDDQCSTHHILVPFQCMAYISFANESMMYPRIQVKLDKYQKCGYIILQTSLLSATHTK